MADNTFKIEARQSAFAAGLPLTGEIRLPFTASHWWDARDLTDVAEGTAVTSWTDRLGGVALTNSVGGTKNLEGGEPYVGFSGTSGSLSVAGASLPKEDITTTIVVARVNTGDVYSGNGPILVHSTGAGQPLGIFQTDETGADGDIARAYTSSSGGFAYRPAYRDAWHVYMLAGLPGGTARFGVDDGSSTFTLDATTDIKAGMSLAVSGSSRRRVRICQIITTAKQLNADEMIATYRTLRSKRSTLTWRGSL